MRNGRKILGVVLVLALAIGLIPGIIFSASAETEYVSVSTFNELQSAVSMVMRRP